MASISSLGIGSGILTSDLLEKLIEAERAPAEARLDARQALVEAKISAFGEINSAVSALNSAMKALSNPAAFNATTVSSSNQNAVSATATSIATNGSYNIRVQQLAQQHTIATQSYASVNEAIGTGVLTFRFGTTDIDGNGDYQGFTVNPEKASRNIVISSSNNTLAGIRDAINSANMGVQATIVDDGNGYRLLMTSTEGGAANSIELTASGTAGMAAFNFNASQQNATQTQAAQDALFSVNGLEVSRNSNLVAGVIPGVTLTLKETTNGPVTLGVSKDPAALIEKVQGFIDSYNQLKAMGDSLTKLQATGDGQAKGSLLTGDATIRRLMADINSTLRSLTADLDVRSLAEIGIRTNQFNNYRMELNVDDFRKAFEANPQAVTALFATTGSVNDGQIEFIRAGTQTDAGKYDINITQIATTGRYQGLSVAGLGAGNIEIDSTNNKFTVRLNSVEAQITLTEGTYATAGELAEEIQRQINSNIEVRDAEDSITVTFNADSNRFEMTSNRYGSESVVSIVNIGSAAASTLGLVKDGSGPFRGNQLASLGNTTGNSADPFDTPLVINSETKFALSINGIDTGMLTVPEDTYNNPDELTAALKALIDDALVDDDIEVFVDYTYNEDTGFGRLVFSTVNVGDVIQFTSVNLEASQSLGLHLGTGAETVSIRGVDVAGTINGVEAVGRGQILTATTGEEAATPGFYLNAPHGNLAASTSSDRFRIVVDGVLSGSITLGTLSSTDPVAVANAMTQAINNDAALMAAGVSVQVQYDANTGGFGIISNSTGTASSVSIQSLQGNAAAIFGFAVGKGTLGASGRDATGSTDPAAGIILQVTGGSTGNRGTIDFHRGIADQLSRLLDSFLAADGLLGSKQTALGEEMERIADDRTALAARLARTEKRLQSSFLANDLIISRFNSTADFLKSQLGMLESLASQQEKK